MELFTWRDLLAYFAFTLSTVGWGVVKKNPKLSYLLNFVGGITMMSFGFFLSSAAIVIINGIWAIISLVHLIQK